MDINVLNDYREAVSDFLSRADNETLISKINEIDVQIEGVQTLCELLEINEEDKKAFYGEINNLTDSVKATLKGYDKLEILQKTQDEELVNPMIENLDIIGKSIEKIKNDIKNNALDSIRADNEIIRSRIQ